MGGYCGLLMPKLGGRNAQFNPFTSLLMGRSVQTLFVERPGVDVDVVWVVGEGPRLHGVTDLPVQHPDAADLRVERDPHRAQRVVRRGRHLPKRIIIRRFGFQLAKLHSNIVYISCVMTNEVIFPF